MDLVVFRGDVCSPGRTDSTDRKNSDIFSILLQRTHTPYANCAQLIIIAMYGAVRSPHNSLRCLAAIAAAVIGGGN